MIYLIQSAYVDEDDNFHKALKIGYAKDLDKRLIAYNTHLPSYKLLKSREGNEDLEKHLHFYFSKYKISNYEWFEYNENIIEEFDNITLETVLPADAIIYEPKVNKSSFANRKNKKDPKLIKVFQDLYTILQTSNSDVNKIIKEELEKIDLRLYLSKIHIDTWKDFYYFIVNNVNRKVEILRNELILIKSLNLINIGNYINFPNYNSTFDFIVFDKFIEKLDILGKVCKNNEDLLIDEFLFKFSKLSTFEDKIKLYCEFIDNNFNGNNTCLINRNIKFLSNFNTYYSSLGTKKIKALGNYESSLKRELSNFLKRSQGDLQNKIYSNFFEGTKVSFSEIKQKLQEIYNELNLVGIAKAKDIQTFFETRDCSYNDKATGKRIRGYELLNKKKIL